MLVAGLATKLRSMAPDPEAVSHREREVLELLALGQANREIAGLLHISIRTAKFHLASIQRKLGLTTRSELVRFALAHGVGRSERADEAEPSTLRDDDRGRR